MRVLLISPPIEDFFFTPQRSYPLGLLYLGTVLKNANFTVKIINSLEEDKKFTTKIPQDFTYLKRYYHPNKSFFSLFSNYYHFGHTYSQIEDMIKNFKPDLVGISSNFAAYFDSAKLLAAHIKKIDKRIIIVFGGRFSTAVPQIVLNEPSVDFVIRGEAEYSFLEFCRRILDGKTLKVKGLCYRAGGKFVLGKATFIENLNHLPFPDRELIDYKKYKFEEDISTSIISSRGCDFGCKFCAINEKFRYRSAENVFKEVMYCFRLGIRHFNFEDDNINLHPEFEKLLDLLISNFAGKIKISFMNGLLSFKLKKLLLKLIKAGLTHADFSAVSLNKTLIKLSNRKENIKDVFYLANRLSKFGKKTTVHFIIGLPQQKYEAVLEDIKILANQKVFLGPSIFYLVIESPYFIQLKKEFGISELDYKFFRSSCAYFDKYIKREQIFFLFYLARIVNFTKNLIDRFSLNQDNFFKFLNSISKDYEIKNQAIISESAIDKLNLSIILLKLILEKYKIFWVKKEKLNNKFLYEFKEEEFIRQEDLKKAFKNLKVCGFSGNIIKFDKL